MLELIISAVCGLLLGGGLVWLYFRDKFQDVLTELDDKKVIIKTIYQHADEIERQNVKQMAKEHNAKVAKVTKKEKTEKKVSEKPKRKYKKQSV